MFGKKLSVLVLCITVCALSSLQAQQAKQSSRNRAPSEPAATSHMRGNLYQVGGGGNAFFYVGPEEVLLIDVKISAESARQMLAEIKKVTDKPVRRVLLTHSDVDARQPSLAKPRGNYLPRADREEVILSDERDSI